MNHMKDSRCCVCGGEIMSEEDLTVCENCNNIYHKNCWQEVKEKCIYCHKKIQNISRNIKNDDTII